MKIGIPREVYAGETRVAVIPGMVTILTKENHEILIETGAGRAASFSDEAYEKAGATIIKDVKELYGSSHLLLKVQPPQKHPKVKKHEVDLLTEGATIIGFLAPPDNKDAIEKMCDRKITSFAMEYIPRITRAQGMDALSSMATIAGYKAVLIAANHLGKMFPLLMTAAGTIAPATVLVLGAGVAGLQAIATAKRLGAKVEAFDPRPVVKEQVQSLGATFVPMELPENVETAGGYARELPEEFLKKEQEVIATRLARVDVVITTAQVFGKQAPLLITEEMLQLMRPGAVIVDLATEQGGNCALVEPGKMVEKNNVLIFGAINLPATVPVDASQMYAKNITNLVRHLFQTKDGSFDFDDEITKGACITHNGAVVNDMVKNLI